MSFGSCGVESHAPVLDFAQVHETDGVDSERSARSVRVLPNSNMFMSCANTDKRALVLRDLDKNTIAGTEFAVPRVRTVVVMHL